VCTQYQLTLFNGLSDRFSRIAYTDTARKFFGQWTYSKFGRLGL
jgi:hypothetical protein